MPRYKLTIAYDGTDFCGWQRQEPPTPAEGHPAAPPHKVLGTREVEGESSPRVILRTVQAVLDSALMRVLREPVTTNGSSRTDSGVHARGQVVAFTCSGDDPVAEGQPSPTIRGGGWPRSRGTDRLLMALNSQLPPDVLVMQVEEVPPSFNPITHTQAKAYSYTLHLHRSRALFDRQFVHHIWDSLDVAAMQEAAECFVGEHDFAGFAAAGHGRMTTVRTVFDCGVTQLSPHRIRIDVAGNGFLWNMVRIIAGTIVEVGRGKMNATDLPAIIRAADRTKAGPTLPPTGLCLEWIRFGASE